MDSEAVNLQQLKIYFLFTRADGNSALPETTYLNDIAQKMELSQSAMEEFRAFKKQKGWVSKKLDAINEIDALLGERKQGFFNMFRSSLDSSKSLQARIVWTLLNLGYSDREYSAAEERVVQHLIERWEMDPLMVAELNDTVQTLLALNLQKEWLRTTGKQQDEIARITEELDRNIASMYSNVETAISEADVA